MMDRTYQRSDPAPPVVPGFEGVRRVWDPTHHRWTARVQPGEFFITRHDELISGVIGYGLCVCIRDPVLRIGGMNLFLLPACPDIRQGSANPAKDAAALHHGRYVMQTLIEELLKAGAQRDRLKAKMYGGGRPIPGFSDGGAKTIAFARGFLRQHQLPVVAERLGESYPRRVMYFPYNGSAHVERLPARYTLSVAKREMLYLERLQQPMLGNPELPGSRTLSPTY